MGKAQERYLLIGALFGWIWMASIPVSLGLFIYAAFFDGPWRWLIIALVVGALSKWLLRGFRDNAQRVAIERHLMAMGATQPQAVDIWHQLYNAGGADGARRAFDLTESDIDRILAEAG